MKRELFEEIIRHLSEELVGEAENPERKAQLEQQLLAFRFLPHREFSVEDHIVPTSVVELEQQGERQVTFWVLVVPSLGGWVSTYQGKPLQILTVSSPLGAALLGAKKGEQIELETYRSEKRKYKILTHF
jgi:transcription elongation GreA/GreB family factor